MVCAPLDSRELFYYMLAILCFRERKLHEREENTGVVCLPSDGAPGPLFQLWRIPP